MKKIDSVIRLREAITQLEHQQAAEKRLLRAQFQAAYDEIQPINLIKNTFKAISEKQDVKQDIINTAMGLGVSYLSKRLLNDTSKKPSKKLIGAAVLLGIAVFVIKNPHTGKSIGVSILNNLLRKSRGQVYEEED